MAEHRPRIATQPIVILRWNGRVAIAAATLALAGTVAAAGPPEPPALPVDRVRIARTRVQGPAIVSAPMRTLRRWLRLCLALPAIRRTPESRSDTPALPTVGRPRDGPLTTALYRGDARALGLVEEAALEQAGLLLG
jgi:hypothetical protein